MARVSGRAHHPQTPHQQTMPPDRLQRRLTRPLVGRLLYRTDDGDARQDASRSLVVGLAGRGGEG